MSGAGSRRQVAVRWAGFWEHREGREIGPAMYHVVDKDTGEVLFGPEIRTACRRWRRQQAAEGRMAGPRARPRPRLLEPLARPGAEGQGGGEGRK